MLDVFFLSLGVDEAVIDESNDEFIQKWLEDIVHEPHEGTGGIGQTHRKHSEFITSIPSLERCEMHGFRVQGYLVEALGEVDLGEPLGSMEVVKKFIGTGQGVAVFHTLAVEACVIDDHSEGSIWLGSE